MRRVAGGWSSNPEHARHLVRTVVLTAMLALAALFVTFVAWFYATPFCGQTFTRQHRAGPFFLGLLVVLLLAALPVRRALRVESSRGGLVLGLICGAVILAGPVGIAAFDLSHGPLSGDGLCGLAPT